MHDTAKTPKGMSSVMNKSTVEATSKMLQEEEESAVVEDSDSKMNTAE